MSFKNKVVKTNYHTHTHLCRHASGTVSDYVKEAINNNFTEIGISDHAPWNQLIDRSVRMETSDYPIYLKELKEAKEKYQDKIKIYQGLEIEYFKNKGTIYQDYLKEMDYLALGQHYIEKGRELISVYRISSLEDLTIYKDTMIAAFKTGYFKFVCHPDIFLFSQKKLSEESLKLCEEIIISAKENNVLLEINANGFRKGSIQVDGEIRYRYPRYEFWKLVKKHNAKCIISSDAHKPEFLYDGYIEEAFKFSRTLSLEVEEVIL